MSKKMRSTKSPNGATKLLHFVGLVVFLTCGLVLLACSPRSSQKQDTLPTLAVLPTETRSNSLSPSNATRTANAIATGQATDRPATQRPQPAQPTEETVNTELQSPVEYAPINLDDGMVLHIEEFRFQSTADGKMKPTNGAYLVIFGSLENPTTNAHCMTASQIFLTVDGVKYEPDSPAMGAVRTTTNPRRDYIGAILGHCVSKGTTEATLVVFNVPPQFREISLVIDSRIHNINFVGTDGEVASLSTAVPSNTPTATITLTPTTTPTKAPTVVQPTAAPTLIPPTAVPNANNGVIEQDAQTYYARSSLNVRACPRTTCDIITVMRAGEAVVVTGRTQGQTVEGTDIWFRVTVNGQDAFIHSGRLTVTPPQPTSPPVIQQQQPPPAEVPSNLNAISTPPPPPVSQPTWNCSGDNYNCGDFNTCEAVMSYFNACPGDPSRLDQGGVPGVPCETLCGG